MASKINHLITQGKEKIGEFSNNLSKWGRRTAMTMALIAAMWTVKVGSDIYTANRDVDSKSKNEMKITEEREPILFDNNKTWNDFINSLSESDKEELWELLKEVNIKKDVKNLTNEDVIHILENKVKPMLQDQSDNAQKSVWLSLWVLLIGLILLNALRNKYEKHAKISMSAEFKEHIAKNLENEAKINALFAAVSIDGSVDIATLEQESQTRQDEINAKLKTSQERSDLLSKEKINIDPAKISELLSIIESEKNLNTLYQDINKSIKIIERKKYEKQNIEIRLQSIKNIKEKRPFLSQKIDLDRDIKAQQDTITTTLTTHNTSLVNFFDTQRDIYNNKLEWEKKDYIERVSKIDNMKNVLSDREQHKNQIVNDLFPGEDVNKYRNVIDNLTQKIEPLELELTKQTDKNKEYREYQNAYEDLKKEYIKSGLLTEDEISNSSTILDTLTSTIQQTKNIQYKIWEDTVALSQCIEKNNDNKYILSDLWNKLSDQDQLTLIDNTDVIEEAEIKIWLLEELQELSTQASWDIIDTKYTEAKLKTLTKEKEDALLNIELSTDINTNLWTVRQAFVNTIDELRWETDYTMEEVYTTFITNIQEIDPNRSLPSVTWSGIQWVQDTIIEQTNSIGRDFFAKTAEVGAGVAWWYHAFRWLLNTFPDIFAQTPESMIGAGAFSLLGWLSIYFTTDAIRKAFQKQYNNSLSKNHSQYITREISIVKALSDNMLTDKLKQGALVIYALAALTTYTDLMWSWATWAANAKKTEIFNVLDKESNNIESNTTKFTHTIDSLFLNSQNKALETVIMEINAWWAWPLTGEKLALIYGKDTTKWTWNLYDLVSNKKVPWFEEGVNKVNDTDSGQLLRIQAAYDKKLNDIKEKMFIVINNENIDLNQVPRLIKNMETWLSDVNISQNINEIKEKYELKIQEIINELIELTKTTNLQLEELESDLSTVWGQPISFKKFDTQALESLINLSLSEPVKKFLQAMWQTNPFFNNMKEMIDTVMNIPAGKREWTLLWLMIVSILPFWILTGERIRRWYNQKKKWNLDQKDDTIILAQQAYDELQNIVQQSGNEDLKKLLSWPSYKAVSKLINIPEDALTKFGKSRTEMGRRWKPRWDRQEALYNNEVKSAKIKITNLIQTHKAILDQELWSFIDHSQLQDTIVNPETKVLYTDRFIRTNAHTEETLCTAIADMMSKSPTFTNLISTQYNTYASINTLWYTTTTTSSETTIINQSNDIPTEGKGQKLLNTIKSGSKNLIHTFKNRFKRKDR